MASEFTATTSASYVLQQLVSTAQQNVSAFFNQDTGAGLTPEEEYFHRILMKYQPPSDLYRTRLISVTWSAIFGTFVGTATLLGLIGNIIVIIAIAGDKIMRRSGMNLLLLNLAIADLFNLLTIVLEWSPAVIYGYPAWDWPAILCPLARYLECTFLFTSILTQLTVCVER
jgi:hypothetical protein